MFLFIKEKFSNYILQFILLFLLLVSILLIAISLVFVTVPYHHFTEILVDYLNIQDKIELFRQRFFTVSIYRKLSIISPIMTFFLIVFLLRIIQKYDEYSSKVTQLFKEMYELVKKKSKILDVISLSERKKILFCYLFVVSIQTYFFFLLPLRNDEAFSYIYLVKKGFFTINSYYPGPNNHMLYLNICWLFDLVFDHSFWAMQLPAFLITQCISLIWILGGVRLWGVKITCLSFIIYNTSSLFLLFCLAGRGHVLLCFFAVLMYFSAEFFLRKKNKIILYFYCFCMILGFYTVPTCLYPSLSISIYLLIELYKKNDVRTIKLFIIQAVVSGGVTLFLYTPIILFNGLDQLIANRFVVPLSKVYWYQNILPYLVEVNNSIFGFSTFISLLFLVGGTVLCIFNKRKRIILFHFFILLLFVPIVVFYSQQLLPFKRVWLYLIPFVALLSSNFLLWIIEKMPYQKITFLLVVLLICSSNVYKFDKVIDDINNDYVQFNQTNQRILSFVGNQTSILINEYDYNVNMHLHNIDQHRDINIQMSVTPIDYIVVLLPKNKDFPKELDENKYKKWFSDKKVIVYKKNS